MKKVTSRWVPHQLIHEQKQQPVKLFHENFAKFQSGSCQLCDIITGDKTWIYHRQIHHKSKNPSWLGEGQSSTTVVRRSQLEAKYYFLNQTVLFLYIVLMKVRREITTTILKIASNLSSRKYRNKDDQQIQKV